ncbi:MAG: NADH-ubiquinone oxidoreductase-F iron-sulfur binding region domain-containing protein [Myxococcota bacterium]|jgi:NADH-quinone oxidoreductase subunit F|nr:NADH-ubiquinone oxidoreductase-F iron-sulfur binding region domain-containing protein [Myxococcota bacterium]
MQQSNSAVKRVLVGMGTCGLAAGAGQLLDALRAGVAEHSLAVEVGITGCLGNCHAEPVLLVEHDDGSRHHYGNVSKARLEQLLAGHLRDGQALEKLLYHPEQHDDPEGRFYQKQVAIVSRKFGHIDPEQLGDYRAHGGYRALQMALDAGPESVLQTILDSGLRGRGGAGFSTGKKWAFAQRAQGEQKVVICNADEGDPGAFMDRSTLESDPHSVLEGMLICGFVIGAQRGYIYCRAEYPLAIARLRIAIAQAEAAGLLGESVLGSAFSFRIKIKEGAGAFVCGEETALIASIEGRRGMPRPRPPYPAQRGLHALPTNINNVETFANIPWIVEHGAQAFAALGTATSKGTKVFALAGRIKRGGLVEVPMGITVREIVEDIGGGSDSGLPIKAVQLGGPSGGCIPESLFDTHVDYEEVNRTGAIMGSGGMVVMDQSSCMVDIARYFLEFTQNESCGKCTFCRVGTKRMLEILERICDGRAVMADLALLEELADRVGRASLCGLGQTAPNPVLTTLRYFRDEYLSHIQDHFCPAGRCRSLCTFTITDACTGCMLCVRACPTQAIQGTRKQLHVIDTQQCISCGACRDVCRFGAVEVRPHPRFSSGVDA